MPRGLTGSLDWMDGSKGRHLATAVHLPFADPGHWLNSKRSSELDPRAAAQRWRGRLGVGVGVRTALTPALSPLPQGGPGDGDSGEHAVVPARGEDSAVGPSSQSHLQAVQTGTIPTSWSSRCRGQLCWTEETGHRRDSLVSDPIRPTNLRICPSFARQGAPGGERPPSGRAPCIHTRAGPGVTRKPRDHCPSWARHLPT